MAKNFTAEEAERLAAQSELPHAQRVCPSCGHVGLRVYYHLYRSVNGDRFITYFWCPVCHAFSGSSGPPLGRKVLNDPLASMDPQELLALDANMEKMLKTLDRLWEQGKLPQEQSG